MIVVTPSLMVGDAIEAASKEATFTESVDEAVEAIEQGGTVFVPYYQWKERVRLILSHWAKPKFIEERIRFAQTGMLKT